MVLKKKRHFHLRFEIADKSEERMMMDVLENKWNSIKEGISYMDKSFYIFRPYNQGFNHFAVQSDYVSTDLNEVVRIAEIVGQELKDRYQVFCYLVL